MLTALSLQVIFGVLSDRFGRKWPLVANLLLCSVVQLGTSFVQTFRQFLVVRSLFGVAMGGVWGLASSTALENLPVEARGLASGVLQQGYAVGYLISAVLNLYLVPKTRYTWRSLFWTTSAISVFAATIRALIPESEVFLRAKAQERARGGSTGKKTKVFLRQVGAMLRVHWGLCVYAVLLMAGAWALQTHEKKATYLFNRFQFPFTWLSGPLSHLS
jgi:MFS transporter, SHS family, lactate transporter